MSEINLIVFYILYSYNIKKVGKRMKNIIYSFIIIILISCARANTDNYGTIQTTADNSFEEESVSERKIESFNNYNSKNEIEENNIKERKLIISVDLSVNSKDIEKSYKSIEEKVKEYRSEYDYLQTFIDLCVIREESSNSTISEFLKALRDFVKVYYPSMRFGMSRTTLKAKLERQYHLQVNTSDTISGIRIDISSIADSM